MARDRPPRAVGPQRHAYLLIEALGDGSCLRETFLAPSDSEAVARVQDVLQGHEAELWRGRRLVARWRHGGDGTDPATGADLDGSRPEPPHNTAQPAPAPGR